MSEVILIVQGRRYGGWKSVRVTRSIESMAGSFALDVSDRWDGRQDPWPIAEEDACRVEIDGEVVIDGFVDTRDISGDMGSRTLAYTGRDRAAALVDCSAVLDAWTFGNITLADFAATIARPFGVRVSVQPGLVLTKIAKIVVHPGDKAYDSLAREAATAGVMVVSDGRGGITITRSRIARAAPLIEGQNIKSASVKYDGMERYRRYVILTQTAGTDESSGDATRTLAEATDPGVRRLDRVLMIRPDKGYSVADARRRADWEARIRAARAETVTIPVQGWQQPGGGLWPLNALTRVVAPRLIGVEGDMLITQVEHSIGDSGEVSQIRLVRPDAFTPEPQAVVKESGGAWKELEKGAL